jgi:hypothetical protein
MVFVTGKNQAIGSTFALFARYFVVNRLISCCLIAVAFFCCASVRALEYQYIKVADTNTAAPNGTFEEFSKSVISRGTAPFLGTYFASASSPPEYGVFMGSGGPLTVVKRTGDVAPVGTFDSFDFPTISGTKVGFVVFVSDGGPLTTIAKSGDPAPVLFFLTFRDTAISGDTVAFVGISTQSLANGVFTGSGGPVTPIAKSGDSAPSGNFSGFSHPAHDGATAFAGSYTSGRGIFRSSDGNLTTVVETGDPAPLGTFTGFSHSSISGNDVVFRGDFPGGHGVFRGDGSIIETVAKRGDPAPSGTFQSLSSPSINENAIAFFASFSGGHGIFVHHNDILTPVILNGQSLYGSTVIGLSFDRFSLDPDGSLRLAFRYALADGRRGVAIAAPIPEPGCIKIATVVVAIVTWFRRRAN